MGENEKVMKLMDIVRLLTLVASLAAALVLSGGAGGKPTPKSNHADGGIKELQFVEGDEKGNEVRALKAELLVKASEQKAVKQIQILLKKYRGTPLEPDLLFRLAELYMRRAKSDIFFEVNRRSDTVVSLAPQEVKKASSRKSITSAIEIYEKIQSKFRNYGQMDVVFFNNGFARQQLGQVKEAEKRYWSLIKTFPESSLVPDCHLAIGEMSFDQQNYQHALDHFNAIKKYPDSRVYPYGLYKAGWTYYNLRDAMSGLKELEKTVAYGRFVVKNGIDARLDLRKEALADMTLFFEEVFPASKAWSYFTDQAQGMDADPYLLKLAYLYKRHSRFKDVMAVLSDFVSHQPLSPLRPEAEVEMILASDNLKQYLAAVATMKSLANTCSEQSAWMKAQQPKGLSASSPQAKESLASVAAECNEKLSTISRRLAANWYKLWRKNSQVADLAESSEQAFIIYLKHAQDSEEKLDSRFTYAELLFQRNKFREASANYSIVGLNAKDSTKSHDALYSALLSLEKAVGDKWSDEDEKKFSSLVGEYVARHPRGKARLDLEFKVALIAYEKNRYADAAPLFLRLGKEFAHQPKGLKSQDLYLDILNLQKKYGQLKTYSFQLRKDEKSLERREKLTKIYEQAYFLEIQSQEESGHLKEALLGYKSFSRENPQSNLAEKAWWNAIEIQYRLADFVAGAQTCEEFYRQFPKSKKASEALLRAAQTYEEVALLDKAAKVLLVLSQVDSQSQLKWKSLAADYLFITGQLSPAANVYEELRKSKDANLSFHALEQLEAVARVQGRHELQKKWLKSIAQSNHEPQASLAHLAELEQIYGAGHLSEAFSEAKKIIARGNKAATKALARARYIQAEILEKEFFQQSVKSRADRVAVVLALKTEKLEKAQQAYQAAIKYGDVEVTVQSLEKLSDLYSHFVESLRNMPLPEGLESRDEPVFRGEMEKLAIPLEEKSVESLAQAVDAAKRLHLRDGSVAKLQRKLNQANLLKDEIPDVEVLSPALVLPEMHKPKGDGEKANSQKLGRRKRESFAEGLRS